LKQEILALYLSLGEMLSNTKGDIDEPLILEALFKQISRVLLIGQNIDTAKERIAQGILLLAEDACSQKGTNTL